MKILEIAFDLSPGGAERFAVDLSNELSKTNEVILLTIKDDKHDPLRTQFYKYDISPTVKYKNLGLSAGYHLGMFWKVYRAIRKEKADIVHLHGHGMPIYCLLAIYLLNKKSKFYQTVHSDIHNGYDNLFYKFLFKTFGYKHSMGFVAISETNYNDMMLEYPKTKGVCIVNGRAKVKPTQLFGEVKKEVDHYKTYEDSLIFLHVARCNQVKNQMLLVDSFSLFVDKGYHAELLIIGANFDSSLGRIIQNRAGHNCHFLGIRKNVGDYMLNADFFCLSSHYEGMPMTILEACSSGLPIVSTPVCGAVDVVVNGKNGYLSQGHSKEEYVSALELAYIHHEELKIGAMLFKDENPYTIEHCADKYMDFFRR